MENIFLPKTNPSLSVEANPALVFLKGVVVLAQGTFGNVWRHFLKWKFY